MDISPIFEQWAIELLRDIDLNGLAPRDDKTEICNKKQQVLFIYINTANTINIGIGDLEFILPEFVK